MSLHTDIMTDATLYERIIDETIKKNELEKDWAEMYRLYSQSPHNIDYVEELSDKMSKNMKKQRRCDKVIYLCKKERLCREGRELKYGLRERLRE